MTILLLREAKHFLNSLPEELSAKLLGQLRALETGWTESLILKTLKGKIQELVVGDYRLAFFVLKGRIYVVDGFRKKSQKTPSRVIARAEHILRTVNGLIEIKKGDKKNRRKT